MGQFSVAGVTFFGKAVSDSKQDDQLVLIADKNNKHDPDALMIINKRLGAQVGFVPKTRKEYGRLKPFSKEVNDALKAGRKYKAHITELTGNTPDKPNAGIRMIIEWEPNARTP